METFPHVILNPECKFDDKKSKKIQKEHLWT